MELTNSDYLVIIAIIIGSLIAISIYQLQKPKVKINLEDVNIDSDNIEYPVISYKINNVGSKIAVNLYVVINSTMPPFYQEDGFKKQSLSPHQTRELQTRPIDPIKHSNEIIIEFGVYYGEISFWKKEKSQRFKLNIIKTDEGYVELSKMNHFKQ